MIDSTSSRRWNALEYELVERSATLGWVAWPELVRPVAQFSSPIMRRRMVRPLPPDPDRISFTIPPVRDVIGPMAWGIMAGVAVLALVGWQAAIVGGVTAAIYRAVDQRVARLEFSFADGFLGFPTTPELAHGVREDNDVRWNWSPPPGQGLRG